MKITKARILNFPDAGNLTIDPKGLELPEGPIPVTFGSAGTFDNAVGTAVLTKTDDGVDADIDLVSMAVVQELVSGPRNLYPAIGAIILERVGTKISKCTANRVVISVERNEDSTIQPLPKK